MHFHTIKRRALCQENNCYVLVSSSCSIGMPKEVLTQLVFAYFPSKFEKWQGLSCEGRHSGFCQKRCSSTTPCWQC